MLDRLWFLPVGWLIPLLSFPLSGNSLYKSLDSSLRWNDDGGNRSIPVIFNLIPVSLVILHRRTFAGMATGVGIRAIAFEILNFLFL